MTPKHIHFIGICGTAMGSTAAALRAQGHIITGSDEKVYPPMSDVLRAAGITLSEGYKAENLPAGADLHVVGNAISRGNEELETVLERRLPYISMAELIKREVIQGRRSFVVSGTHGKTTTTTLLAWLLEHAGRNPGFLIGGVPANFESGARFNDSEFFVIEGDEYDTAYFDKRSKFLHYLPECVIVNNIEFDHADIFRDLDDILLTFQRLLNSVPRNGLVLLNGDDANCLALKSPAPVRTVGLGPDYSERLVITGGGPESTDFTLNGAAFSLPMIGEFNARNAAMAVCAARHAGLSDEEIRAGLASFKGIRRRQQVRGEAGGVTVVDDFGHHPTAIRETLRGMRRKYPGRRLWAVFEPRSNTSRRNLLQNELIAALREADGSVVASVANPEKVPAELRLDPDKVAASVTSAGRACFHEPDTAAIVARLKQETRPGDVVIVFSNGGFDGIHDKLLAALQA
ncbi:MAG TPA: UDP-N-acetylmuramate:L-alanyl-gamma-D-glutamyl-meso-diaminopimelate ligase [Verrucomicrobiales bacterium]|nr:UDP-N-acetylmuramate:L-alanyl-gamma-D-glutamyl-meso-diaminopimelate ligase [Verrucomicrobiales bacterium]HRJ07628.1 UDP-N-acetylmuramate:L-alanyl-gamma-D-glutamyl-meso-diaminopimelate ligase [Prosthecobacter sp.]HRK13391.1 UDP-N-acetylmuramate:L-alanyl-gamma-D-glutamyl-meso-diaminopimelate ligase [Prosthecobacter sp.]